MKRILDIDEVPSSKEIALRMSGEDIVFQASSYRVIIYINEDEASKLIHHLGSILQDRHLEKKVLDK